MAKIKPALGRGLASLIPRPEQTSPAPSAGRDEIRPGEPGVAIPLDRIDRNPFQPRADFDPVALDELQRSIREKGVIQPVTVRRRGDRFQLISGERRVRAARMAGLTRIPAYVIQVENDEEMLELALVENLQRSQLNPIEIGISYRRLIDECRLTQDEVAQRIGKDRTTVTNFLRLLKLPEEIQASVRHGDVTGGHARALVAIDDERQQLAIFRKILKRGLSVRQVEQLVRDRAAPKKSPRSSGSRIPSVALASSEDRLREVLGTRVVIRAQGSGRGEILIEFYSSDDLDRLLEIFEQLS
jgi:ParB family chromosome partitioning protein